MATTAEAASSPYEGGVGGKFRSRKPNRGRPSTPYDRPPIALRNPSGRNGWISKLVDPASRIITASATKLFSSVFRKRLTAPPSDVNLEPRHEPPKENPSSGVEEQSSKEGENPSNSRDSTDINELEQLLKQKTFTRVEFNHLTELLRSRTVDLPADVENRSTEPFTSQLVVTHKRQEKAAMPGQENGEGSMLFTSISTPAVGLNVVKQVPEEDASPTELAKAYMGSRPSKVSPSKLGLRSQTFWEDPTSLDLVPFAAKSPSMSFMPRSAGRYSGVRGLSESCYIAPRQRGRSAMSSVSRTPYSGVRSTATVKGIVPADDGYAGPSTSSHWTEANSTLSGVKQVLKRSSSVLDNDFGSGGPMRRIRQRYNMISPPKDQVSISSIQKPLLLDGRNYNTSNPLATGNGDNRISSATLPSVPPQSSEMARKILQQLDKLVPSPKGKSSELEVAMARDKSPTKLTLNMLNGRALRSMEDINSPQLQNLPGNDTPNGTPNALNGTCLLDSNHSASQKQDVVRENGPVKAADVGAKLASKVDAVKNVVPVIGSGEKPADFVVSGFDANTPQVKRAFQMSAPDDYVDLDDDSCSGKDASVPKPAEEEKPQPSVVEHRAVVAETVTVEKPPVPTAESKPLASFTLSNRVPRTAGASDVPVINVKDDVPIFPKTPESITISPPAPIPTDQSPSLFNGSVPLKHETAAPVFSFGPKNVDKVPTVFAVSLNTSSFSNASGLKSDANLDSKLETLSSNSTAVDASLKATGAEKRDKTQKDGDLYGSLQNPVSTSTTSTIFSFGASKNSSPSNGTSTTSVSVAPSAPIFGSSLLSPISSSSGTTTTSSSILTPSVSAASPIFSTGPTFLFTSGTKEAAAVAPSNPVSQLSTTSGLESTDSEPKPKKASPFNISAPSLSTSSSPAFTMTGNDIFGFNASTSSSTTNPSSASCQSQSSNSFGTASAGSLFGSTQAAPAVSSIIPFTQSAPSQCGSSTSSPTFGLSNSAFSFGSSPFGSSAPGAKLFSSGSGFGLGSSTSLSTGGGSFSSSSGSFAPSGTASSLLGSSSQSATPSFFGSGFGSTSSSLATGFSFGASAAATPASGGSTPLTFGASSGSMFSFNSAAPAAHTISSSFAPSQPVFGVSNPVVGFGSTSPGNDQMNEDSMAEDTVQASSLMPVVPPVFGQPVANSPPPNFSFGSPAITPSAGVPSAGVFQFGGGHQNLTQQMTSSQFPATGSLPGGSFSLGAGGGDKANRRFVRVRRDKPRKK
ncbi:nuclear pore complex protein NUP1 [Magnolia sinica]|uniref:nuclear pore complex protein NUP1 n=1 Tax=Magnolia sinica TaxID=86752 RepID=UPI002658D0FB|nr:nuclear pore complex protein NUP1 [Magnolia sinica]